MKNVIASLNENERKALEAICDDCDEIDGWGFTRPWCVIEAIAEVFDGNYQVVGGYMSALLTKNLIDMCAVDNEIWVSPDVYEEFC